MLYRDIANAVLYGNAIRFTNFCLQSYLGSLLRIIRLCLSGDDREDIYYQQIRVQLIDFKLFHRRGRRPRRPRRVYEAEGYIFAIVFFVICTELSLF